MMEEKEHIGQLFDGISGTYDKLNHLLSLNIDKLWRRKAVSRLQAVSKLLDVAIGTADLSLEILRQGKAGSITGIDLSRNMMEIGLAKCLGKGIDAQWLDPQTFKQADASGAETSSAGTSSSMSSCEQRTFHNQKVSNKNNRRTETVNLPTIRFMEASALDIPFADNSFDALTCAYGVRNFSNLDRGLSEMYRVLHGDGQLLILEFSYPSNCVARALYDFFFSKIMPLIGRMVSHDPKAYTYFRNSVKNFIWGDAMAERLKAAGFRDVSYKPLTFGITTIYLARK